jgi:hypothetical protein
MMYDERKLLEGEFMKKTILTLCIGMLIGLMAGSITGTFAAIGDRVEAIVAEYTITVDGVEQILETSPVAINDSTYVPLRTMANMLGKDVIYKADSRTIELNTPVLGVNDGMIFIEPSVEEKKMTIDEIEGKIFSLKLSIKGHQVLASATDNQEMKDSIESPIAGWQEELKMYEAMLAELKAQKAVLEAQP